MAGVKALLYNRPRRGLGLGLGLVTGMGMWPKDSDLAGAAGTGFHKRLSKWDMLTWNASEGL